jgi:hypothetical protein
MTDISYPTMIELLKPEPVYKLRIYVYENGELNSWDFYSGQEMASLEDTINELWRPTYNSNLYFDVDCEYSDDGPSQCYLYCGIGEDKRAAFPEEWLTKTLNYGYGKTAKTYRLVGDKIPIRPEQYGLSPWPADVKVLFEIA